ncbi:MAG: cob(I)yrinic acid a,c-diamide adenosyltransferase [Clostridiales bacterium]|nr:cob(I)yrinic acid a,c-diamide adenosyltransferase [Clostridiales bacterium]
MSKVQVYYGNGRGKTSAALGCAINEACRGGSIIIIEFLKKKDGDAADYLSRLEPEIRIFRFQRSGQDFGDLSEEEQAEESRNMLNGLGFAKKVILTGECSKLVLDEILGLADRGIVSEEDIISLLKLRNDDMDVILTGRVLGDKIREYADEVFHIESQK